MMAADNQPGLLTQPWFYEYVLFPAFVAAAAAAVLFLLWRRLRFWLQPGHSVKTAAARVVSVQSTLSREALGDTVQDPHKTRAHFFATFACEDGSQHEYKITRRLYETLKKGDQGLLTVKGLRFIRFEKEQGA
jgi:hypothetical protein